MNESILLILALAPGVVGIAVSKLFAGDVTPEPLNQGIVKYFIYSTVSILLAECLPFAAPLSQALNNEPLTTLDITMPLLIAFLLAAFWRLFLESLVVWIANKLLSACNKNNVVLRKGVFASLEDNQGHIVEIIFPDGRTIKGMTMETDKFNNDMILAELPEWTKDPRYEEYVKQTLILTKDKIIIKEYGYRCKE